MRAVLAACALVLCACGGDDDGPKVASIEVGPTGTSLAVGADLQLNAIARDNKGNELPNRQFTWTSSNPSVLSVSASGRVFGVAAGSAGVRVETEGQSAQLAVTVAEVSYVTLVYTTFVVQPSAQIQFSAAAFATGGVPLSTPINWNVADASVASVSTTGSVTGLMPGATTLTVTAGSASRSVPIAVQTPISNKIAFLSVREERTDVPNPGVPGPLTFGGIYLMNSDGTNPVLLVADSISRCPIPSTDDCRYPIRSASLASDGLRVALTAEFLWDGEWTGTRVVMCATGQAVCYRLDSPVPFFPNPWATRNFGNPVWARDGSKLAYNGSGIWVWNGHGGPQVKLHEEGYHPAWSPDGGRVVFVISGAAGTTTDIWAMNADGSNVQRLTNDAAVESSPVWSPDGRQIAYVTDRDGNTEIYVMNSDGAAPINLTQNLASDGAPSWSPDGSKLAFHTNRDGNYEIYVMGADGSNPMNLTSHPAPDLAPSWSP